jgi:LEA14-like dessication related protein
VLQRFSFTPPTARLERITVTAVNLSGGSLRLQVDVLNPNPYQLAGSAFSAEIELEGTPFGSVSSAEPFILLREQHALLDVDLRFSWAGIGAAARSVIDRGSVAYQLRGRLLVDTPVDQRWVNITTEGRVAVQDLTR